MHIFDETLIWKFYPVHRICKRSALVLPFVQMNPLASVIDINVGILLDNMGQVCCVLILTGLGLQSLVVLG